MILNNIRLVNGKGTVSIRICDRKITAVVTGDNYDPTEPCQLRFENAIAFPGLINSHDHLDFNSFPQLGNTLYKNYSRWGGHIHAAYKKEIEDVLKIPNELRTRWGMYKNLLCGVTTVVNHGNRLKIDDPFITVFQNCNNLHSVAFEKSWMLKLNNPFKRKYPYVIHTGEGTDQSSFSEIDKLVRWNVFNKQIIGIHGVAMNREQAKHFKAIVWCPASNYFLLDRTASINDLKHETKILFGTDSTLTAGWNIWDHIRMNDKAVTTDEEVFAMLTTTPSSVWGWPDLGKIEPDCQADVVVAKANGTGNNFSAINPEDIMLVLHQGEIRLFDEILYQQLVCANHKIENFHKINLNGTCKYVYGNLPGLIEEIRGYFKSAEFPITIPN